MYRRICRVIPPVIGAARPQNTNLFSSHDHHNVIFFLVIISSSTMSQETKSKVYLRYPQAVLVHSPSTGSSPPSCKQTDLSSLPLVTITQPQWWAQRENAFKAQHMFKHTFSGQTVLLTSPSLSRILFENQQLKA